MKQLLQTLTITALVGAMLTSCVDDVITNENSLSSDYIAFNSTTSTTRASIADLPAIQLSGSGFSVFATGGSNPTGWYADADNNPIDGTNNYRYVSGQWSFDKPVKWPSEAHEFPMTFYALYPASPAGLSVSGAFSDGAALIALYTVQEAGKQVDLLAAEAKTNSKPATGHLTLAFKHILSKINFGIIAGTGTTPVIQSLQVNNVDDINVFDFVKGDWSSTPPANAGNASYTYFGAPSGNTQTLFTPSIRDERTANAIYTGAHNRNLMLMPQTSPGWKPVSGSAPDASSDGYISVVYRMETGTTGINEVGFADAREHPDNSNGAITGPLFVKVGFPLAKDAFTWEKGHSYTYNIGLGTFRSCNGFILDDY
jgi:hypothetical protein